MSCLGCNAISGPAHVLADGRKVCTNCPAYRDECLARDMLTRWTLTERREWLAKQKPEYRAEMERVLSLIYARRAA